MGPLSRVAGGARLLGEPSARIRGWARGLAHAETRKAGDQVVPASGLGEVLATGWAVAGGGAPGSLFSQLRSAGWTRTCAHTHTLTLLLSPPGWSLPPHGACGPVCRRGQPAPGPAGNGEKGGLPGGGGRGPSEVPGSRQAWPGSCRPWGSQSSPSGKWGLWAFLGTVALLAAGVNVLGQCWGCFPGTH